MNETPAERTARLLAQCEIDNPGYHEAQRLIASDKVIICPFCNQFIP